jgi:hypothetical protein
MKTLLMFDTDVVSGLVEVYQSKTPERARPDDRPHASQKMTTRPQLKAAFEGGFVAAPNVGSGSLLYTGCILNQRKHRRIHCREAEWRGIVPSGGGSQE